MGVTVTTNLQLIKPDQNESIKQALPTYAGWASQNATNQDKIDAIFRNSTGTYTVNWTGSVANPTFGAGGSTEGKYVRLFPRLVIVSFKLYAGAAGFGTGSGQYRINAPFALDPVFSSFTELLPVGKAIYYDNSSATTCSAWAVCFRPSDGLILMRPPEGDVWSSTNPVVPALQDRVSGYFVYPTAAA
jgi:hypothetical protein